MIANILLCSGFYLVEINGVVMLNGIRKLGKKIVGCFYPAVFVFVFVFIKVFRPLKEKACGQVVLRSVKNKGEDVRLHGYGTIIAPERVSIGSYTRIGRGVFIHGLGGVVIGENCQISRGVTIYSSNHDYKGGCIPYDAEYILKPVVIGCSVWIGMNACILPGVSIGEGAIIGMGTVVSKDVDAGEIVVGAGQRVIGKRELEKYIFLKNEGKFYGRCYPDN